MKKTISLILCALMLFSIIGVITASAAMADEAEEYELGVKYDGALKAYSKHYFKFVIAKKSHVSFNYKFNNGGQYDRCAWTVYSADGSVACTESDLKSKQSYNMTTADFTGKYGKNYNAGTYYLEIKTTNATINYSFTIDAEAKIKLAKGVLSSVKSLKKAQFVAKCKKATDAIGYQFQYSTNEQFKKGVKTVKSAVAQRTVKRLKSGKRYYVRVRPYTIYTDGTYVYGQYSLPKSVKIK